MGLSFLGSCYLIYKISEILFPKEKIFNTVFFAFNPLVIIEGLVSSHNDFPLVFFALLSIYLYLQKKKSLFIYFFSFFNWSKIFNGNFTSGFFLFNIFRKNKKKNSLGKSIFIFGFFFSLHNIFATLRTTFQPWYLIFPFSL